MKVEVYKKNVFASNPKWIDSGEFESRNALIKHLKAEGYFDPAYDRLSLVKSKVYEHYIATIN
jgi:hypothetical protein